MSHEKIVRISVVSKKFDRNFHFLSNIKTGFEIETVEHLVLIFVTKIHFTGKGNSMFHRNATRI